MACNRNRFRESAILAAVGTFAVEYSHYLQHIEDGTRFVENFECDADLRAAELLGGWNSQGFKRQCLEYGLSEDQIFYVDDFAILEAKLAEKRS